MHHYREDLACPACGTDSTVGCVARSGPTLDERRRSLEAITRVLLSRLREDLDRLKSLGFGVTIFAFDFEPGAIAYISTAERAGMIETIKIWLANQEAGLATDPRGERPQS